MKVLLADFNKYAGVMGVREKVFCNMANALSEHGYEVSCLVMDDVDEPPFFIYVQRLSIIIWNT